MKDEKNIFENVKRGQFFYAKDGRLICYDYPYDGLKEYYGNTFYMCLIMGYGAEARFEYFPNGETLMKIDDHHLDIERIVEDNEEGFVNGEPTEELLKKQRKLMNELYK